jgi:hypothetical protein
MGERKTETNEVARTDTRIEQAAHDIIVACEVIRDLTGSSRQGTPRHRQKQAALSAQFHAEGILNPEVAAGLARDINADGSRGE